MTLLTGENVFLNYASKMLPEFALSLVKKTVSSFYSKKKIGGNNLSSMFSFFDYSKTNENLLKHHVQKNNKKNHSV